MKSKDDLDDPVLTNRMALNEVLSPSMPQLHHAAARVLRNWHDSEDALQDGLLSAWCHVDQFEGRSCMSTWLHTIVTNAARMQLRKRGRSQMTPIADDLPAEDGACATQVIADSRPSPEEECARREQSRLLQQRVRRLPPSYRSVVQLCILEGLLRREAAVRLGVTTATVKTRLHRAWALLRRHKPADLRARRASDRTRRGPNV